MAELRFIIENADQKSIKEVMVISPYNQEGGK